MLTLVQAQLAAMNLTVLLSNNLNVFFIDGFDGTIACYQIPSN